MKPIKNPVFSLPCIARLQSHCLHQHTTFEGSFHFSAGDVFDDIIEVCTDCGINLAHLPPLTARQDCIKSLFLANGYRIPKPMAVSWSWYWAALVHAHGNIL